MLTGCLKNDFQGIKNLTLFKKISNFLKNNFLVFLYYSVNKLSLISTMDRTISKCIQGWIEKEEVR